MNKRPLAITVISWIFIVAGSVGFLYHLSEFRGRRGFDFELAAICIIRLLAILAGIFMLRGHNWARWLLIVWIAYHVVLSFFHSAMEVLVHGLLLVVVAFFLFRPQASTYFRKIRS